MRLKDLAGAHLTYCSNVHPGETLAEVESVIAEHVTAVKRHIAPSAPFGAGLRLAARAADELMVEGKLDGFRSLLDQAGLYVFTLNGFPYGAFHGTRVKERVYRPDWLEGERVRYTTVLARVLAALLPEGVRGSISTVPGCFKPRAAGPESARAIALNVARAVAALVRIERECGKRIDLALEPEPFCLLETSDETVTFFEEHVFARETARELARLTGSSEPQAELALRRHAGVCLDTCHASVEFEAPLSVLERLRAAGIEVPKIQISAGLSLPSADEERRRALGSFRNDVYFHQTVVRREGLLIRFLDLPDALESELGADSEWRVHFHVPVFHRELGVFDSTQADLVPLLAALRGLDHCPHLEVETYTWDVLPVRFRDVPVTDAVARELAWTLRELEKR